MCGRFALYQTRADLRELFELEIAEELDLAPRYNVAPSQFVPVVRNAGASRTMAKMRWGFEPHWSNGSGSKPINARGETVARSPSFRESFASRRCLVPLSGYYEWQAVGSKKQPYFFRPPVACAFAGIWDQSGVDDAATFAIVTTLAVPSLTKFHERMPVVLERVEPLTIATNIILKTGFPAKTRTRPPSLVVKEKLCVSGCPSNRGRFSLAPTLAKPKNAAIRIRYRRNIAVGNGPSFSIEESPD